MIYYTCICVFDQYGNIVLTMQAAVVSTLVPNGAK